jgi:hypothetical protein
MDECNSSKDVILSRIGCILTYGGERNHIVINYALFVLNTVWCYFALVATTISAADTPCATRSYHYYYTCSAVSLLFVVAFQVVLCLIVGCSGISIIWCAQAGWIVHQRYHYRKHFQSREALPPIEIIVLLVDVLAILYYAVTMEAITTVAHGCALVLGSLISLLVTMRAPRNEADAIPHASSIAPLVPT